MQMNSYLWSLYLNAGGQAIVDRFAAFEAGDWAGFSAFILSLVAAYCPDSTLADDFAGAVDEAIAVLENSNSENADMCRAANVAERSSDNPRSYADEAEADWHWFQQALPESVPIPSMDKETLLIFCDNLVFFSVLAYAEAPNAYLPYFFPGLYNVLTTIAELFEIVLPETPSQRNYRDRFQFYYALCSTFSAWRETQNWTSAELCAFLYDFAPKFAGGTRWIWQVLPEPRAAFVVGASPDSNVRWQAADADAVFSCQGNPDTQPGDLILMYQWAPKSAFTSVWSAVSPGFVDPLCRHYRCIYIGNPRRIPPLSYQMLKSDPFLEQLALVKTRMFGMNGTELKPSQYNALWDMMHRNGEICPPLPPLTNHFDFACPNLEIQTEHDVERLLLEPLLARLGWTREHYVRQMPLRMGRGHSVYPDYVLLPQFTPNCEKAFWVVEAKKSIPSAKQLRIDCNQAASYAYRLDAAGLMLVAQEGIWLADRKDDFGQLQHYTWEQLQNSDVFSQVFSKIGYRKERRRHPTRKA